MDYRIFSLFGNMSCIKHPGLFLTCSRHYSKHVQFIILFYPHSNSRSLLSLYFPEKGNQGHGELSDLSRATNH